MTRTKAVEIRNAIHLQREAVADDVALKTAVIYPSWESLVEGNVTADKTGFRFKYGDQLYKTRQDNLRFAAEWVPGVETGALYEAINEIIPGTQESPIPFVQGMAIENGKYYTQDDVLYLCIRDSGTPLYHNLSVLIGNYVNIV